MFIDLKLNSTETNSTDKLKSFLKTISINWKVWFGEEEKMTVCREISTCKS